MAEIWGYLREKVTSGFAVKITFHPIKKYYVYPRPKCRFKTHVNAPGTAMEEPVRDHADFNI